MKNIIFCADGAWNGPGRDDASASEGDTTNVLRLFVGLAGQDDPHSLMLGAEQERSARDAEGRIVQVAKYLHGAGDSRNPLLRLLGGTFEAGLIARILRGYSFISRVYTPGDAIHIAGFSRGAYTARALGGLIAARGLLDASRLDLTDRQAAYRLSAAVWQDWRREAGKRRHWRSAFEQTLLDLPGFVGAPMTERRIPDVPIASVAVWDTVGSLGIPDYVGISGRVDQFRFADVKLPAAVEYGFHALAIDERRADFAPVYWQPDPRVIQALFPGAHGDVGGGYKTSNAESGLSDAAFVWMKDHLAAIGVLFQPHSPLAIAPDPAGVAHQPWTEFPFSAMAQGPRELPDGLSVAPSTRARLAAGPVQPAPELPPRPYRPINLHDYI